jgi:hypothetical protein
MYGRAFLFVLFHAVIKAMSRAFGTMCRAITAPVLAD